MEISRVRRHVARAICIPQMESGETEGSIRLNRRTRFDYQSKRRLAQRKPTVDAFGDEGEKDSYSEPTIKSFGAKPTN
jgi:hypothetical protein